VAERRYCVRGEIDLANATELQDELMVLVHATDDDVVVDCTHLTFIDSTGIAALVYVQRLLDIQGRWLRIENLSGSPRRSFEVLGLADDFEIAKPEAV
jgi:anti-sigma B factor antagonist